MRAGAARVALSAARVGLAAALLCAHAMAAATAHAARPERVVVHARLDARRGEIAGALAAEVAVDEGEASIALWSYAHRLTVAPDAMDELSWRWIFPGEVDRGHVVVTDVRVDGERVPARLEAEAAGTPRGIDVRGASLRVPVPAGRARAVVLRLRFRVRLPSRFGRLGRDGATVALGGPWYPLVVAEDAWDLRPHQEVVLDACPGGAAALPCPGVALGDAPIAPGHARWEGHATYVPAVVSPALVERVVPLAGGRALRVRMPTGPSPPSPSDAGGGLSEALDVERHTLSEAACARLAVAADAALATLAAASPAAAARAPRSLVALVLPSRTELVAAAPGVLLVSDRFGEVSPVDATGRFHERAAVREWLRLLVAPLSAALDPPGDRPWADDLRATLLLDLDETRRRGRAPTPRELLGFAAFHPAVDQLLYAPQVPFPDVYFDSVDELDRFRDDPTRAFAPVARGRRLLEALRDSARDRFERAAAALLAGRRSARASIAEGGVREDRVDGWLRAPVEPVNYALGAIRSRAEGGGFVHEVEVRRSGAARTEPVEVRVTDEDGATATGWWDGEGDRGVVRLRTGAPLADAHLDPRERLPQSPSLTSGHPRADDATTHPWRPPLLQALSVSYSASEGRFDGLVDFAMRRRYDLDRAIALRLETGPATTGGILRYVRGIGPKRDTNSRIGVLLLGAELERIRSAFAAGTPTGWGGALIVSAGLDTRRYRLDWRYGVSLGAAWRATTGPGAAASPGPCAARSRSRSASATWSCSSQAAA
jgi:hypothetical protein